MGKNCARGLEYGPRPFVCTSARKQPQTFIKKSPLPIGNQRKRPSDSFLALYIRNKICFGSQEEAHCEINHNLSLMQKTFIKYFESGVKNDFLATNLRPTLRLPWLSDKDLMKQVNDLAFHQVQKQSKLGATEPHPHSLKVSRAS